MRTNSSLNSLTGLRFVAMVPVFLVHGALLGVFDDPELSWAYLNSMGTIGHIAVCYFFILSGFVLTWAVRPGDTARSFWERRLFRVFPNYLLVYAVTLALMAWMGEVLDPVRVVGQLLLLQAWVPDPAFYDTGNTVTWSLSADMAFYALFPLMLILVNRIKPGRLWYWVGGAVAASTGVAVAASLLLPSEPPLPLPSWNASDLQYWFVYYLPLARLLECLLGMLLARIVLTGKWIGLRPAYAAALLVAAYLVATQVDFLYRLVVVVVVPLALLTAAVAAADNSGRGTWMGARAMVWLGNLSYAFYLVHNLVLKYGHFALGRTWVDGEWEGPTWGVAGGLAFLAGSFVVSLLLAWGLYALVEQPIRGWSRRRSAHAAKRNAMKSAERQVQEIS